MFKTAGTFPVVIVEAILSQPQFSKEQGAFDVAIQVQGNNGEIGWCRKEWSSKWGVGNFSDKQQWAITLEMLHKIGLSEEIQNAQQLAMQCQSNEKGEPRLICLIGVETTATVKDTVSKKDGKTYYNIVGLGGGQARPEGLDFNNFMASVGLANQNNGAVQQQQPAAQQQPAPMPNNVPNFPNQPLTPNQNPVNQNGAVQQPAGNNAVPNPLTNQGNANQKEPLPF